MNLPPGSTEAIAAGSPKLRTASFCSGIGAPEKAWTSLGWKPLFFSEIDPFASAVLSHHYPDVPNLGDMTEITDEEISRYRPDVVVAGTPCQSFSVAGLRGGMADPRGSLALRYVELLGKMRSPRMVWENVPGVLSSWTDETAHPASEKFSDFIGEAEAARKLLGFSGYDVGPEICRGDFEEVDQTNDFDQFTAALVERGYSCAWGILDAQYFGVAQRRERVFLVGSLGNWTDSAAVLFDRECLSGNPAPSREAGARVAASLTRGADSGGKGGYAGRRREDDTNIIAGCVDSHMGGGGPDDNSAQANHLVGVAIRDVSPAIKARDYKGPSSDGDGDGDGAILVPMVAGCLNSNGKASGSATQQDAESGLLIAGPLTQRPYADNESRESLLVTHSLRAEGFDASEDGTGPGTPIIPVRAHNIAYNINGANSCAVKDGAIETERARALDSRGFTVQQGGTVVAGPTPFDTTQITSNKNFSSPQPGDPCHPLTSHAHAPAVAYRTSGNCGVMEQVERTAALTTSSDPNATIIAIQERAVSGNIANGPGGKGWQEDTAYTLEARHHVQAVAAPSMAVRRLTPRECERLQGFSDDFTAIQIRDKVAADAPRYRAIGNSMAVPVLKWIGERIEAVEKIGAKP